MNNDNANKIHAYKFVQYDNRPNEICLDTLSCPRSLQILVFRSLFCSVGEGYRKNFL